jgi:diadenosine tetraphosphate (Ap4A) HIT family hydrolase
MNTGNSAPRQACELCSQAGGEVLWRGAKCRVVLVADSDYAGYCRVIWQTHVKEMTDLGEADRLHCMRVVLAVEQALRTVIKPHKVNLAEFGNLTPHLHWHVIARDIDDAHFPNSIWGEKQRAAPRLFAAGKDPLIQQQLTAELSGLLR